MAVSGGGDIDIIHPDTTTTDASATGQPTDDPGINWCPLDKNGVGVPRERRDLVRRFALSGAEFATSRRDNAALGFDVFKAVVGQANDGGHS